MEIVKNKEDILERLNSAQKDLAGFGVSKIGLFGSFIRGTQSNISDVDFLVEFIPARYSFDNFMELSFFLEELLGRKVEVLTPDSLSSHIAQHILSETVNVRIAA